MSASNSLLVAAIDFGTTYSGWAFSFKHEFEADPTRVSAKPWTGGQLVSSKGPTCALIKPDGKNLETFGYEAESRYAELAEDGEHRQWYLFKRFKMLLHGQIGVKKNIMLEDVTGKKKLPAKTVFMLSIQFLKDDLIKTSQGRLAGGGITANDIHWVLTVPAIWNDAAKQFMREAAVEAGIREDQLTIALEPEAASLLCKHIPVSKSGGGDKAVLAAFKTGTKYMVLDAGGGTVDITVHQVMPGGRLKELHKASGGAWGGTKVDEAYRNFLMELAGKVAFTKFQDEKIEDFIDLFRHFEIKKRELTPDTSSKVTLRLPISLAETYTDVTGGSLKDNIPKTRYAHRVVITADKIRVDADIVKQFFDKSVKSIIDHVSSLLQEPDVKGCETVVMVGGFSESHILQQAVRAKFCPEMKLFVPQEAGLAVLKGAVVFGHSPTTIASRICKFTYGTASSHLKNDQCSHLPTRTFTGEDGNLRCGDIFSVHVRVGQSVNIGEEQEEQLYTPINDSQKAIDFAIFASSSKNPSIVTVKGCHKIGTFRVPLPSFGGTNRKVGVSMMFGGTEIQVKFVNKITEEMSTMYVDFLG